MNIRGGLEKIVWESALTTSENRPVKCGGRSAFIPLPLPPCLYCDQARPEAEPQVHVICNNKLAAESIAGRVSQKHKKMDPVTSVVIVSAVASGLTLLERIVSKLMKVKKSKCCGGEIEFGPDSPRPAHHEHAEPESTPEQDKEGKK